MRRFLAILAPCIVIISYCTCIGITIAEDTYIGGLDFPFFSDTGRDKPAYYVFSGLNCTASALLFMFMILQFVYVTAWHKASGGKGFMLRAVFALIAGFLAPVGSILLSIFTTNDHPALHAYSAYAFFFLILVYCIFTMTIMYTLSHTFSCLKKMVYLRFVVVGVLAVAVVLYIPVGLGLGCDDYLSIVQCKLIETDDYCEGVRKNDLETNLFDYTRCKDVNTMRSASQFVSIMLLMLLMLIHAFEPFPPTPTDEHNTEPTAPTPTRPDAKEEEVYDDDISDLSGDVMV